MLNKKLNIVFTIGFFLTALVCSTTATAHPRWILPSHFSISKEGGDWLTFDVTASHGTFVMDKPAGSETARVIMPDGRKERPDFVLRGKRRSVFDFYFSEEGTYKVQVNNVESYITHYKIGSRDTVKRMRVNKAERKNMLPKGARDVTSTVAFTRAESYISLGKPTKKAFELEGKYLEMMPITHPSDIVATEPVNLQFYFNGKEQGGVKVEITRDGTLYRNHQEQIDLVSDENGGGNFVPEIAGRYILKASHKGLLIDNPLADKVSANVHFTFEAVLP